MELPSGRFSASGKRRRRVERGLIPAAPPSPAKDHLGALPDDLLLIILARLRCIATAARTCVLSRRWRGLWTHLPSLVLRDIPFSSIGTALDALQASSSSTPAAAGKVSLLDIRVADQDNLISTQRVTSLLSTAAWFLPEKLSVAVPLGVACLLHPVDLPSFDRATSISLSMGSHPAELRLPSLPAATDECLFPMLTTVVLSGYYISGGLANLVTRCPHLRVLKYTVDCPWSTNAITVQSQSLRELVVEGCQRVDRIDIAAPMLKKLTMSYYADADGLTVSVAAPMAEEVLWHCRYGNPRCPGWYTEFGCWELLAVIFMTGSSSVPPRPPSPPLLRIDARAGPSNFHSAHEIDDYLEQLVEKHMVTVDLSIIDLELLLTPLGHVYGALVLYLLRMRRVCTALRMLKLRLLIPKKRCRETEGCQENCSCEPTDWRSQTISLPRLEEVEINGFQGADHEFDFLELLFRCAPMLRRMTVKQSIEATPSDAKILAIFKTHPCVECYLLSSPC